MSIIVRVKGCKSCPFVRLEGCSLDRRVNIYEAAITLTEDPNTVTATLRPWSTVAPENCPLRGESTVYVELSKGPEECGATKDGHACKERVGHTGDHVGRLEDSDFCTEVFWAGDNV